MRLFVPNTRRISWASQKACPKPLNIKPTRCNPPVFPCQRGGCGGGRGQQDTPAGLGTEPHNTFYTHTHTHVLGHICQMSFSGQVVSLTKKHKPLCVEIHAVTLKIYARQSKKLVHDHFSFPSLSQFSLLFSFSSHISGIVFPLPQGRAGQM